MVEDKDMDIKYIGGKENPANITTKNVSEDDYVKHTKRITEGEIWEFVETGRENFKNNGVLDGVMYCYSTEYSYHALADAVNN